MSFQCDDCDRTFRSEMAIESHCYAKGHTWEPEPEWYCDLCDRAFSSERGLEQHCETARAHRTCNPCNRVFSTVEGYERHCETAVIHRTCQVCDITFSTVNGYEMHCANSQKHRDRLRKPVECNFCDRVFKSPSALAQHMESGFHNVHRHQVTQAVRSLRVIPTITLPVDNYIQGHISGARIEAVGEEYGYGPQHQSANLRGDEPVSESSDEEDADDIQAPQVGLPVGQFVEPGPPLRDEELAHSTVMTGPPRATAIVSRPVVPPLAGSSYTTYVPADFLDLGIPYSCHLCLRTFRTILALTMHLNSAVHDPDAFICPGPKCKATFTLVSGLMQHLESGKCGLSSKQEVFERFEKLTGRFSKLLKI